MIPFEERRQAWLAEVRERLDLAISTGRRPTRLKSRCKGRYVPSPPAPPVPIVTQYQQLRARVLAGELTPAEAGRLFSRAG